MLTLHPINSTPRPWNEYRQNDRYALTIRSGYRRRMKKKRGSALTNFDTLVSETHLYYNSASFSYGSNVGGLEKKFVVIITPEKSPKNWDKEIIETLRKSASCDRSPNDQF